APPPRRRPLPPPHRLPPIPSTPSPLPSSPAVPCRLGRIPSRDSTPFSDDSCFDGMMDSPVDPSPASRLLISSDWWLSSHSPFFEICISFPSYLSLSRPSSTLSAERNETSCSVDCPPYSIPTFNFTISFHS